MSRQVELGRDNRCVCHVWDRAIKRRPMPQPRRSLGKLLQPVAATKAVHQLRLPRPPRHQEPGRWPTSRSERRRIEHPDPGLAPGSLDFEARIFSPQHCCPVPEATAPGCYCAGRPSPGPPPGPRASTAASIHRSTLAPRRRSLQAWPLCNGHKIDTGPHGRWRLAPDRHAPMCGRPISSCR